MLRARLRLGDGMNTRGKDTPTATGTTTTPATTTTTTTSAGATTVTTRHHRRLDSVSDGRNSVGVTDRSGSSISVLYKWVVDLFYTKRNTKHSAIDNDKDIEIDTTSSNSFLQGLAQGQGLGQGQGLAQIQGQGQGQERGLAPGVGLYDVFVGTEDPKVIITDMATGYDIT